MPPPPEEGEERKAQRSSPWRRAAVDVVAAAFAATVAFTLPAAPLAAEPVALTFDDLPVFGALKPVAEQTAITKKLLRGLTRHHLPAIGFVNEINLTGADRPAKVHLLTDWLDAGMDLGNHTYSHPSLSHTPVADYIVDTAEGEVVTKPLLAQHGRTMRWFRYPYLETGASPFDRKTFEDWLGAHGYRVAPVTLENEDYAFADPYDAAVKAGDARRAKAIRAEYLAYTAAVVPWYRSAALALLGRRPALVWLLHASRLNADSIDALARIIRANDLDPVTLDAAMADPAYGLKDDYTGPNGIEWLERWSLTLHRDLPWATMPKVPADITGEAAKLDDEPGVHGVN